MAKNNKETILLSTLFSGKYLEEDGHVGGEIINMYQSDNGKYYVYVPPHGDAGKEHDKQLKKIFFIIGAGTRLSKIIGIAEGNPCTNNIDDNLQEVKFLEKDYNPKKKYSPQDLLDSQKEFIDNHDILYGGIKLYNLGSWTNTYVYYEVLRIRQPKKDIYLTNDKKLANDDENIFLLKTDPRGGRLKVYIDNKEKANNDLNEDFKKLIDIAQDEELWGEPFAQVNVSNDSNEESFLDIIHKSYDELTNSNLLAYFIKTDNDFWKLFAEDVLKIKNQEIINAKHRRVIRESFHNIDLLIEIENSKENLNENYVIVIENKIKASVHLSPQKDNNNKISQLKKYQNTLTNNNKYDNWTQIFYLLRPNYNNKDYKSFDPDKLYTEIKYSDIKKNVIDRIQSFNNPSNIVYKEFKTVVNKHSSDTNNELQEIIDRRFINQIKSKLNNVSE